MKFNELIEKCGGGKKLADLAGISEQTVSRIKRNAQIPTLDIAMRFNKICKDKFNADVDWFDMLKSYKLRKGETE